MMNSYALGATFIKSTSQLAALSYLSISLYCFIIIMIITIIIIIAIPLSLFLSGSY